jgi:hypothetical protein
VEASAKGVGQTASQTNGFSLYAALIKPKTANKKLTIQTVVSTVTLPH